MAAIDLYTISGSGPCLAVILLAEELKLNINIKTMEYTDVSKPEFQKINPQHCVPTINDNGFILWESHAIMQYLVNKFAPDSDLYPSDLQKRATVDRVLNFYLGALYPSWLNYFMDMWLGNKTDPEKEKAMKVKLEILDKFLENSKYAAGSHVTIADMAIISGLTYGEMMDYDISAYVNITKWKKTFKAENPKCGQRIEKWIDKFRKQYYGNDK